MNGPETYPLRDCLTVGENVANFRMATARPEPDIPSRPVASSYHLSMVSMRALAVWISLTLFPLGSALATAQSAIQGQHDRIIKPQAYDIVSIKPVDPGNHTRWHRVTADGLSMNLPLKSLIMIAYSLQTDDQLSGLPSWAVSAQFDVEAKMDADTADRFAKLPSLDQYNQRWVMMQALLAAGLG
jgi:hypothetical protein